MGEETPSRIVTPDDDPQSELNVLRREVRQLQASVRDAGLQVASQQDEIIELRAALAAAEAEVDEGLVREANLRMQLELQSLKRQQVESTMAAAEALVSSLREMIMESEIGHPEQTDTVPDSPVDPHLQSPCALRKETGSLTERGESKLDQVLSSITDESTKPGAENADNPESSEAAGVPAMTLSISESRASETVPVGVEQSLAGATGDTNPTASSSEGIEKRASIASYTPVRTLSHPQVSLNHASLAKRHSLPRTAPSVTIPTPAPAQKSNLLMSAFRPTSATVDHHAPAIHSSSVQPGVPLPTEVAKIAKSEGVQVRRLSLPTSIVFTVSEAHSGEIYALASSPGGQWTVSGGDDKTVRVYDKGGKPYATITESTRAVTALGIQPEPSAQNPDAIVIYSGGSDGTVRAFRRHARRRTKWNLSTVLPVHSQAVRRILVTDKHGMSGSSNLILTCSTDRTICLCDVERSRKPFSVTSPSAVLDVASFGASANGLIVSGHKDGSLRLWSSRDGNAMVGSAKVHAKGVVSVSCLDDGHSVLSLGRDNVMRLSDVRMTVSSVRDMEGGVQTVSDWHRATASGQYVACGSGRAGQLGVWNVDTGKLVRRLSTQSSDSDADVLDMVARKLRNPGCVIMPIWTASGLFVCAHRTRQVTFWNCS